MVAEILIIISRSVDHAQLKVSRTCALQFSVHVPSCCRSFSLRLVQPCRSWESRCEGYSEASGSGMILVYINCMFTLCIKLWLSIQILQIQQSQRVAFLNPGLLRQYVSKTVVDSVNNSISIFLSVAGSTTKPKVMHYRPAPSGRQGDASGLGNVFSMIHLCAFIYTSCFSSLWGHCQELGR